ALTAQGGGRSHGYTQYPATAGYALRLGRNGVVEKVCKNLRDLRAAFRSVLIEPPCHPVDRTHEEKHGQFWIDLPYAAVGHALLDNRLHLRLRLVTARGDDLAVGGIERLEFDEDGAIADLAVVRLDEFLRKRKQNFTAVPAGLVRVLERAIAEILRQHMALEQDFLLVLDVIIERGLGHAKRLGDIVERRRMISLRAECARRLFQQGGSLQIELLVAGLNGVVPRGKLTVTARHHHS
ncbi:hypothetical protein NS44R_14595, partial [Mammaliicoccus sciuri]